MCVQVPKDPDLGVDADRVMKEEQQKIDEAEELSEALIAEKEDLLNQVGCNLKMSVVPKSSETKLRDLQ